MSKKPTEIPPPPATGGSHTWDEKAWRWVTTDETLQPWDERHGETPANAPAEQPVKDA